MDGEDVGLLTEVSDGGEDTGAAVADVDSEISTEVVESGTDETTESTDESTGDGRQIAAAVKNHLAELKRINPALEKQIRGDIYAARAARDLGPIPELRALKESVELYGGSEGLATMAETVENAKNLDGQFERGDPSLIEGWAKDFPDGFKKLVVPAFDKLAQIDPAYYEKAASTVATKFLGQFGVFDAMSQIGEALTANKMEDAIRVYNDLVKKVFSPMRSLASQPTVDTSRDNELSEREKKVQESEDKVFMGGVRSRVNPEMTTHVNKVLATLLGTRKLTTEQGNKIRRDINSEIAAMVNSQPEYQKRYTALQRSHNEDALFNHVITAAKGKTLEAVKKVMRETGFASAPKQQTQQTQKTVTQQQKGIQQMGGEPDANEVDWRRSTKANYALGGPVWLLNGRQAKWK